MTDEGIRIICDTVIYHAPNSDLPTYDRFLSWFKSLKERYIWKSSNEQTDAL